MNPKEISMFRILSTTLLVAGVSLLSACGEETDDNNNGNTAPTASFSANPTCTVNSNTVVTFTSTSTDADGDTLACSWVIGNGTPPESTDCTTMHTFPSAAPYTITLTVEDGNGGTDTTSQTVGPC